EVERVREAARVEETGVGANAAREAESMSELVQHDCQEVFVIAVLRIETVVPVRIVRAVAETVLRVDARVELREDVRLAGREIGARKFVRERDRIVDVGLRRVRE